MLQVKGLVVGVDGREILRGVDLSIGEGETHLLLGPNGSGKTTLLGAIVGMSRYRVLAGEILFRGEDVVGLSLPERVRLGMGLAFQRSPTVRGVTLRQMAELCLRRGDGARAASAEAEPIEELANSLDLTDLLSRDLGVGFSGGEAKRAELLQLLVQRPSLALLDEPDSGVDLEGIALVGAAINALLERDRRRTRRASGLIITHAGYILDYVAADVGHVLVDGRIVCSGNPRELLEDVRRHGYARCVGCLS
jgi:Fe-S cluster assembly ATP-binding protein